MGFSALFSAVSGLDSNGKALSVIGDNIANANTVGFKSSRINFMDLLSQRLLGLSSTTGIGSAVQSIDQLHSQGTFASSAVGTDLAIDGEGFFILRDGSGAQYYTRAGQFRFDQDRYLVNPTGYRVQGYLADQSGQLLSTVSDLQLSDRTLPAHPTEEIELYANLDASEAVPAAFDIDDADNTANFSSGITVYDSLGNSHLVNVYFRKEADNSWEWHAVIDEDEVTGTSATGDLLEVGTGTLTFNTDGSLQDDSNSGLSFSDSSGTQFDGGAADDQTVAINFGDELATSGNTGLLGSTQFARVSSVTFQSQDGYTAGALESFSIDSDGMINGSFTNGTVQVLGQIALATFQNTNGLQRAGGNVWVATGDSGPVAVNEPNSGRAGTIFSGMLEGSNVDLATEFVNLIQAQRGFQANARTISVNDQLLQEVVNIVR